jgi:glycosyltransferase involved in cell wall biosynthesis
MNLVQTTLRNVLRKKDEPLNILCFPTHERYESMMCRTGHNFYSIRGHGIKDWNEKYAQKPDNYHLLPPFGNDGIVQLPGYIDFDLIMSHNKLSQYPYANVIRQKFGIPMICVEHTLPLSTWSETEKEGYRNRFGDVNVFVSEYQFEAWGFINLPNVEINHTGIDITEFRNINVQRKPYVLSVCNYWVSRDAHCGYYLWEEITGFDKEKGITSQPYFPIRVVGTNPGLSKPASDVAELVYIYNEAAVLLNTTLISSLPTVIIEAMACECPVVSTATCLIPEIMIEHGINGFVSNNPEELRKYCLTLLHNPELCRKIGKAGRRTVEDKFSSDRFVRKWEEIFMKTINRE